MVLHHWVKESEKGEDYPFAKFDKKIELVELNDELYESFGNGTEWGKEETFYLW